MKPFSRMIAILGAGLLGTSMGAPPEILHHQGRLSVESVNFDGIGQFRFALVTGDPVTETLWTHDGSGVGLPGAMPSSALPLPVVKGHYGYSLGEGNPIPSAVFESNEDVRLRFVGLSWTLD